MRKYLSILIISVLTFAFAQPQGGAFNPEMRALIEPYTNLITSVGLILELEKTSDLAFSAEQVALIMPILTELDTSVGYDADRALELLDTIELEILTIDQLTWIDGEFLRRQEVAQNEGGLAGGFGGARPQGAQAGQGPRNPEGQGQRNPEGQGQRQGGQAGFFQRIIAGEAVNMFTENENAGATLDELIALLSTKLN